MARETHELWSWDERNGHWLAIAQGTERAMKDGAQSRYGSSRKFKMWGSAFTVTRRGDGPHDTPAALGVEVVTAPAEPADSQTPPGRRLVIADDTKDDVVAMLAEAESEIAALRATVDRVRQAANATFDDPMVAPASAATAERILRALDGAEAPS